MIKIEHLTKKYGEKVAVKDLSLTVEDGDLFAFCGLNGAGKSTTIKSIVGINKIDKGEIFVDGKSVKNDAMDVKKIIAYVPDTPQVYPYMKGIDYVKFILAIYGEPFNEKEMLDLANQLEISNDLNTLVSNYSHGMQQKIVLLAAFLHHPRVLILDEPFVGLDPKATHFLKEKMKEYVKEGNTIFFSTHVLEVAEKLCNKVAIISQGELKAVGTMAEVKGNKSLEEVFLSVN